MSDGVIQADSVLLAQHIYLQSINKLLSFAKQFIVADYASSEF